MLVIGIDCATELTKVGIATCIIGGGRCSANLVEDVSEASIAKKIRYARSQGLQVLLAMDAPLGWPRPLARTLADHSAGEPLHVEAHALFRRTTDRQIKKRAKLTPLDVGADRIARTAYAALAMLAQVREQTREPIPLVWEPVFTASVGCIEVYPAATLRAHCIPNRGYKGTTGPHAQQRREIVQHLCGHFDISATDIAKMEASDHSIDALACVLAARDFRDGKATAPPPEDIEIARQEGWIWASPSI